MKVLVALPCCALIISVVATCCEAATSADKQEHGVSRPLVRARELAASVQSILKSATANQEKEHGQRELQSFAGKVTSMNLVQALFDNPRYASTLVNNMIIPINWAVGDDAPTYNINATVSGPEVKSVMFGYNSIRNFRIENGPLFAFCGNNQKDFYICKRLTYGTHTVTATPYSETNGRGAAGTSLKITFQIRRADTQAPALLNLVALSDTTIDVTKGDATVDFQVKLQDTNGVLGGFGSLVPSYDQFADRLKTFSFGQEYDSFFPTPIIGPHQDKAVTFNFSVTFQQYLPPDVYEMRLTGVDFVRNSFNLQGIPVAVTNANPDTKPPELLSLKTLFNNTAPVSLSTLPFEITIQDNLSGFDAASTELGLDCDPCDCEEPDTGLARIAFIGNQTLVGGKPHTLAVDLELPDGLASQCDIYVTLYDAVRSFVRIEGEELEALGFPGKVKTRICDC